MRITLTIDDDLLEKAKDLAGELDVSVLVKAALTDRVVGDRHRKAQRDPFKPQAKTGVRPRRV